MKHNKKYMMMVRFFDVRFKLVRLSNTSENFCSWSRQTKMSCSWANHLSKEFFSDSLLTVLAASVCLPANNWRRRTRFFCYPDLAIQFKMFLKINEIIKYFKKVKSRDSLRMGDHRNHVRVVLFVKKIIYFQIK